MVPRGVPPKDKKTIMQPPPDAKVQLRDHRLETAAPVTRPQSSVSESGEIIREFPEDLRVRVPLRSQRERGTNTAVACGRKNTHAGSLTNSVALIQQRETIIASRRSRFESADVRVASRLNEIRTSHRRSTSRYRKELFSDSWPKSQKPL